MIWALPMPVKRVAAVAMLVWIVGMTCLPAVCVGIELIVPDYFKEKAR